MLNTPTLLYNHFQDLIMAESKVLLKSKLDIIVDGWKPEACFLSIKERCRRFSFHNNYTIL